MAYNIFLKDGFTHITEYIFFPAGRKLVEYEFQKEIIVIESENDVSVAVLKIVFRRRVEYHLTNTFLQTFILTMVGFMSFFFNLEDFTDRMMVSLTTLLVLATFLTSIQSVSHFKSFQKCMQP